MSGFSVDPDVVDGVGKDMLAMADAVELAKKCVTSYVHVDTSGGTILNDLAGKANSIRETLEDAYGTGGGAYTTFEDAGNALKEMARDYERTDEAQRATYDSAMEEVSTDRIEYMGGNPSILLSDYEFVGEETDGFEEYDKLKGFSDDIDYILGLDWISSWTTMAGILDPFSGFKEALEGDWKELAPCIGALQNLDTFWTKASSDIGNVTAKFVGNWVDPGNGYPFFQYNSEYNGSPNWSGNAADATSAWIARVAQAASDHEYAIYLRVTELQLKLQAMYEAMDLLIGTVEDLIQIMPWGQSFSEFVKDLILPWEIANRLKEIAGFAGKALGRVKALITVTQGLFGILSGLLAEVHTLSFPDVHYSAPAVNG